MRGLYLLGARQEGGGGATAGRKNALLGVYSFDRGLVKKQTRADWGHQLYGCDIDHTRQRKIESQYLVLVDEVLLVRRGPDGSCEAKQSEYGRR